MLSLVFLAGPSFQILPLYIYSLVRLGVTPEINAICSNLCYLVNDIIGSTVDKEMIRWLIAIILSVGIGFANDKLTSTTGQAIYQLRFKV